MDRLTPGVGVSVSATATVRETNRIVYQLPLRVTYDTRSWLERVDECLECGFRVVGFGDAAGE